MMWQGRQRGSQREARGKPEGSQGGSGRLNGYNGYFNSTATTDTSTQRLQRILQLNGYNGYFNSTAQRLQRKLQHPDPRTVNVPTHHLSLLHTLPLCAPFTLTTNFSTLGSMLRRDTSKPSGSSGSSGSPLGVSLEALRWLRKTPSLADMEERRAEADQRKVNRKAKRTEAARQALRLRVTGEAWRAWTEGAKGTDVPNVYTTKRRWTALQAWKQDTLVLEDVKDYKRYALTRDLPSPWAALEPVSEDAVVAYKTEVARLAAPVNEMYATGPGRGKLLEGALDKVPSVKHERHTPETLTVLIPRLL
jgi:hypothetical protein